MTDPKKKLRFIVRQIEFTDMQKHFEAISEAPAEYALKMSRDTFLNISAETVKNDCIAFSQLLRMKRLSYRDLKPDTDGANGKAYGQLKEDFVVVSFARGRWKNVVRIPPRSCEDGDNTRAVTQKTEDMAEWLFLHGFTVQDEKTRKAMRYVRFSGSANMSRTGKVMFVNAAHEPELSRRVTLGLEDNGCLEWAQDLIPSKWDAYKGLCLSDGYALAWLKETTQTLDAPELSEVGVVFVKDMKWGDLSVSASPCDVEPLCFDTIDAENGDSVKVDFKTGDYAETEMKKLREKACLTDGVGLIAPAAARWISEALCGNSYIVSTFQIRLPFVKGMVHAVDFPAYLAERGVTEIRDAWGNRRPVSAVWMVLPLSIFKAHKWFKQLAELSGLDKTEIPRLYHEKIREYGHDLVITQRHMHKDKNGQAEPFRLNYEVLQTCGLNEEKFNDLLLENLKQYAMLRKDRKTRFEFLVSGADSAKTDEDADEENVTMDDLLEASEDTEAVSSDEDEEITETANAGDVAAILAKAVRKNPALLYSKKAKAILAGACNALAFHKLLRGKLALPKGSQGESRYLSCDLGRYLDYLVSLGGGAKKGNDFKPLSPEEFYAPGFRAEGKYCALFRTPHYSRNEHLVLRPLSEDTNPARKRWFGHLRGVLMIPAESFAAARLGGADFDGDHVSVVDDNIYVGAVEHALKLSELDAAARDLSGGSVLPFIVIPDASESTGTRYNWDSKLSSAANREALVEKEFRAFRISCENLVGVFSNYAFTHGATAYGAEPIDKDKEQLVQKLAALCGMEIDAAKTGKKPEFPKGAKVESGCFLSLASKAKSAKKPTWEGESNGKGAFSLKKAFFPFEQKDASLRLLDKIPEQLLDAHKNPKKFLDAGSKAAQEKGFRFSDCFRFSGWDGRYCEKLLDALELLYQDYNRVSTRLYFKRKNRKPVSYNNDLIRILWPRFLESGDNIGFDEVYKLCKRFFSTLDDNQKESIRSALGEDVPFEQTRDDRESRLMESFKAVNFNPEQEQDWNKLREQLLNFEGNGFCLPYLMLNLEVQKQEKAEKLCYNELNTCKDWKGLLAKTREIARNLCKKAFPGRESEAAVLLVAHLAKYADDSIGKESFFWMIVGEKDALLFLRDTET